VEQSRGLGAGSEQQGHRCGVPPRPAADRLPARQTHLAMDPAGHRSDLEAVVAAGAA
jgi:hypothetical protein